MDLLQKAQLIIQFTEQYLNDEEFEDFFIYNDLGVPMAICYANGMVELKEDGQKLLNETYLELCSLFNADENANYEDLDDLIG